MKFGFGLITCQRAPGERRSNVELYRDALDLVVEAERLGFDSAWVSEHHFWDDEYMSSLLPFCAAAGARTERITIGTAILLAPLYDPLRLAEDAATVDLLCGGRFVLGLGQGWMGRAFDALGIPLQGRHLKFEHMIATLRQAWADDDGAVTGTSYRRYPDVFVTPKPSRPGGPQIWLGADHEPAMRRSGRLADGFISSSASTPELFRQQVGWVRDEAATAGRTLEGFVFGLHRPTFPWHGDDAWERIGEKVHYVDWKYQEAAGQSGPRRELRNAPPMTPDRSESLKSTSLVGRPDEIVEKLAAFEEAAGQEIHYVARLYWPGLDPGVQRETMTIFAEEVISRLRR